MMTIAITGCGIDLYQDHPSRDEQNSTQKNSEDSQEQNNVDPCDEFKDGDMIAYVIPADCITQIWQYVGYDFDKSAIEYNQKKPDHSPVTGLDMIRGAMDEPGSAAMYLRYCKLRFQQNGQAYIQACRGLVFLTKYNEQPNSCETVEVARSPGTIEHSFCQKPAIFDRWKQSIKQVSNPGIQ